MLQLGGKNGLLLKWGKRILTCSTSMKCNIFLIVFHELPFYFFFFFFALHILEMY